MGFEMLSLMIFLTIFTAASTQLGMSKSASGESPRILAQTLKINSDGSYSYSYDTENGIHAFESGQVKNSGSANEILSVEGSYSYTAPDGTLITVTYIADENGYRAVTKTGGGVAAFGAAPEYVPQAGFHTGDEGFLKKKG